MLSISCYQLSLSLFIVIHAIFHRTKVAANLAKVGAPSGIDFLPAAAMATAVTRAMRAIVHCGRVHPTNGRRDQRHRRIVFPGSSTCSWEDILQQCLASRWLNRSNHDDDVKSNKFTADKRLIANMCGLVFAPGKHRIGSIISCSLTLNYFSAMGSTSMSWRLT